jgi:hypothetical protein
MAFHRSSTALPPVIPTALHRPSIGLPTAFHRVCVPPPYTPMAKALALEGGASLSKAGIQRIIEQTIQPGKRTVPISDGRQSTDNCS